MRMHRPSRLNAARIGPVWFRSAMKNRSAASGDRTPLAAQFKIGSALGTSDARGTPGILRNTRRSPRAIASLYGTRAVARTGREVVPSALFLLRHLRFQERLPAGHLALDEGRKPGARLPGGAISMPSEAKRWRVSSSSSACESAALAFFTIASGVPFGNWNADQAP